MKLYEKEGKKNRTGAIGEAVTQQHLKKRGFAIKEVNYLKKFGEIDVVAQKINSIHFIEVKTVSYGTRQELESAISRGTWRPEENVHRLKNASPWPTVTCTVPPVKVLSEK